MCVCVRVRACVRVCAISILIIHAPLLLLCRVNLMVHKMEGDHASSITVMKTQAKKMSMEVEGLKKALEQKVEWSVFSASGMHNA